MDGGHELGLVSPRIRPIILAPSSTDRCLPHSFLPHFTPPVTMEPIGEGKEMDIQNLKMGGGACRLGMMFRAVLL